MEDDSDGRPARPARRRLRVAATILAVLVLIGLGLWAARRPIAGVALDRRLARAGVPASYTVEALDLGRQRLRDVVIGDPARPDLVADWIETGTRVTWRGATVTTVRAGRVRLRGRLIDGRVSLGAIDRLVGPPTGRPFTLPRLYVEVADARVRLETPAGVIGLRIAGTGRLDDGFAGRLAAVSERVAAGGCAAERVTAAMRINIADAAPTLVGPVRVGRLRCGQGGVEAVRANVDMAFAAALDAWRGSARLSMGRADAAQARVARVSGTVDFDGTARRTSGRADLAFADAVTSQARVRRLSVMGRYRIGGETGFDGRVRSEGVSTGLARLDTAAVAGTPIGPIASQVAANLARAGRAFGFDARLSVYGGKTVAVRIAKVVARSASGARLRVAGGDGVSWSAAGLRLDGDATVSGGGLPGARVWLDQAAPGAPIRGIARVAPLAADGSRLALGSVAFTASADGATRITSAVTLSGPIAGGRVEGLAAPLDLVWDGRARLAVNRVCTPVAFRRLAVAGLTLAPTRVTLCPTGPALVSVDGARVSGGATIAAPRLAGRLGSTSVTLTAGGAEVTLGTRGFALREVTARLGSPGRLTRIDAAQLEGALEGGGAAGRFTGTSGQIANVPILLSGAAGTWRVRNGALTLAGGGATITDGGPRARFEPLRSDDLALRLADGRIAVTGTLLQPATGARVTDVRIAHSMAQGTGEALLDVPGVTFDERLQPETLTRLAFGVVADVRGRVSGEGRIAWSPQAVTSTGVFRTDDIDLAAAFGPVEGLAGTIRFDDLLSLRSAPGQVATVRSINPGIAVTDGVVRYQSLEDARIRVEGGRWPFAGGELVLEPTLLDFGQARPKAMTFRVAGVQAGEFLQQFDFDNLNATGVFDGVLPMIFDERGGRIEGGTLRVRQGGGTIAYAGVLGQKDLGTWGDLAFNALRSLRYRDLNIVMDGPLAGEMVTQVRFAGISQGEGAKSNFLIRRLQRLPFVFNIRIKAPFRGLIDSARGFYDPARLVGRNLPALIEEQNRSRPTPPVDIQPPASRKVP